MASFAKLDGDNIVIEIVKVSDDHEIDGEEYLSDLLGGRWIRFSFNSNIRRTPARLGCFYDESLDCFFPNPKPYPSWILDEENMIWKPPISIPNDGNPDNPEFQNKHYQWNEEELNWKLMN